jgi:hypothetical protein
MNEERDEILDDLRALMAIEPTVGFEQRVARAVEAGPPVRRWWMLGAVAATGAAAVLLVGVQRQPVQRRAPEPVAPQTAVAAVDTTPVAVAPTRAPIRRPAVARNTRQIELKVLVPPDQARTLQQLMAAVRDGRTVFVPTTHGEGPLVIEPLPDLGRTGPETPDDGQDDARPQGDSHRMENHVFTQA